MTDDKRLFTARTDVPNVCVVSSNIDVFFRALAERAEQAVLGLLAEETIAESLAEIRALGSRE